MDNHMENPMGNTSIYTMINAGIFIYGFGNKKRGSFTPHLKHFLEPTTLSRS